MMGSVVSVLTLLSVPSSNQLSVPLDVEPSRRNQKPKMPVLVVEVAPMRSFQTSGGVPSVAVPVRVLVVAHHEEAAARVDEGEDGALFGRGEWFCGSQTMKSL